MVSVEILLRLSEISWTRESNLVSANERTRYKKVAKEITGFMFENQGQAFNPTLWELSQYKFLLILYRAL